MKIEMTSTSKIVHLDGVPARVWEGHTLGPHPVPVIVCVTRLAIDAEQLTQEQEHQWSADLDEQVPPSPEVAAIPLRLIL